MLLGILAALMTAPLAAAQSPLSPIIGACDEIGLACSDLFAPPAAPAPAPEPPAEPASAPPAPASAEAEPAASGAAAAQQAADATAPPDAAPAPLALEQQRAASEGGTSETAADSAAGTPQPVTGESPWRLGSARAWGIAAVVVSAVIPLAALLFPPLPAREHDERALARELAEQMQADLDRSLRALRAA